MRMDQLAKFLAKNEVDPAFQKKIKEYMEFKLDHERTLRETDQVILDSVTGSLKSELLRQINGKVLKNNVLFQRSFGSHFLLSLSMSLNEKVLPPDEYIFRVSVLMLEYEVKFYYRKMKHRISASILLSEEKLHYIWRDIVFL